MTTWIMYYQDFSTPLFQPSGQRTFVCVCVFFHFFFHFLTCLVHHPWYAVSRLPKPSQLTGGRRMTSKASHTEPSFSDEVTVWAEGGWAGHVITQGHFLSCSNSCISFPHMLLAATLWTNMFIIFSEENQSILQCHLFAAFMHGQRQQSMKSANPGHLNQIFVCSVIIAADASIQSRSDWEPKESPHIIFYK